MNTLLFLLIAVIVLIAPFDAYALRQVAGIPDLEMSLGETQEFTWGLISDKSESIPIEITAEYAGSEFLVFPESITLEPKTTKYITVKIVIPDNAKVGYYNPSLYATEFGEKGGSVVLNVAMEKPLKITIIDTSKTIQPEKSDVTTFEQIIEKTVEKSVELSTNPIKETIEKKLAETPSSIICGTGTVDDGDGTCLPINKNVNESSNGGGGCLIATATYGSEMSPQVQQLRELRDNSLLQTESGTLFMESFNQFYYSFSPYIADLERENSLFKELVKITLTPLISSLSILNYVDMNSEESVLGYGVSLIILNGMMYVGIPVIAIIGIRKNIKS